MFERFTESARRALFFSRYEASEFGSLAIETEHILLGLLREQQGVLARLLTPQAADAIRAEIGRRVAAREKIATSVEIPFSSETKRVLIYTSEEADRLNHSYIAPEHMLLGLLREEQSIAASILRDQGLRANTVREDIAAMLGESPAAGDDGPSLDERIVTIKMILNRLIDPAVSASVKEELVQQIGAELDTIVRRHRRGPA
jgi:ATP-dependent Clp protease ATP-binding subunit ClpC